MQKGSSRSKNWETANTSRGAVMPLAGKGCKASRYLRLVPPILTSTSTTSESSKARVSEVHCPAPEYAFGSRWHLEKCSATHYV